ncbi:hypothetical protein VE03_10397, partial [Pseudogymnoascus sp. 23342-1-I1]
MIGVTHQDEVYASALGNPLPGYTSLPPLDDLNLFAIIHGDAFIRGSGLEGFHAPLMSAYVATVLRELGTGRFTDLSGVQTTLQDIADQFEDFATTQAKVVDEKKAMRTLRQFASDIATRTARLVAGKSFFLPGNVVGEKETMRTLRQFASDIASRTARLVPGESFFLPGSCVGGKNANGGHAMIYEITCESGLPDTYSFTVYNTGAGTQYHPWTGTKEGTKAKISDTMCYAGVPASTFGTADAPAPWLLALLEPMLLKHTSRYRESDLYRLFAQAGGHLKSDREEYVTGQRGGTCTFQVLLAVVRNKIPRNAYKQVKLEMRVATILARLKIFDDRDYTVSYSDRFTMEKAIENAARSASKMLDESRGTGKRTLVADQVPALQALLSQAMERVRESRPRSAGSEVVSLERMARLNRDPAEAVQLPVATIPQANALPDGTSGVTDTTDASAVATLSAAPRITLPGSSEALAVILQESVKYVNTALEARRYQDVIGFVDHAMETLTLTLENAKLWAGVAALETLETLDTLLRAYLSAALREGSDRTQDLITSAEIGATAEALAARCMPSHLTPRFDWRGLPLWRVCGGYLLDTACATRLDRLLRVVPARKDTIRLHDHATGKRPCRELKINPTVNEYQYLKTLSQHGPIVKQLEVLRAQRTEQRQEKPNKAIKFQRRRKASKPKTAEAEKDTEGLKRSLPAPSISDYAWSEEECIATLATDLGNHNCLQGDTRAYGLLKHMYLLCNHAADVSIDVYMSDPSSKPLGIRLRAPDEVRPGVNLFTEVVGTDVFPYYRSDLEMPNQTVIKDERLRKAIFWPTSENEGLIAARSHASDKKSSATTYRISNDHYARDAISQSSAIAHAFSHTSDYVDRDRQVELALVLGFRTADSSLLREQLGTNPALACNLAALVQRGLEFFTKISPAIQPALFFCWLGREVAAGFNISSIRVALPNTEAVVGKLLATDGLSSKDRVSIHMERLASIPLKSDRATSHTTLLDALESMAYIRQYPRKTEAIEALVAAQGARVAVNIGADVQMASLDPAFLAALGQRLAPLLSASGVTPDPVTPWTGCFPLFQNGAWQFDASAGAIYLHGLAYSADVLSELRYTEPFYTLYYNKDVSESRVGSMFVLERDDVRIAPRVGQKGRYTFHKRFEVDGTSAFYEHVGPEPFHFPDAFTSMHFFWRGASPEMGTLVTTRNADSRYIIAPTAAGFAMHVLGQPGFVNNPGIEIPASLTHFSNNYGHLLHNASTNKAFIDLPTAGLRFALTAESQLAWGDDPRYFVDSCFSSAFNAFRNHIPLITRDGKRKVILPWASFQASSNAFVRSNVSHTFMPDGPKYFACSVNNDNSLCSTDPVTSLQIAYILLLDCKSTEAAIHLRLAINAPLSDKRVLEIIRSMVELRRNLKDNDPDALAVIAHAITVLAKSLQGFSLDKVLLDRGVSEWERTELKENLLEDLLQYVSVAQKVDGRLRLTLQEERGAWQLWPDFKSMTGQGKQRQRYLGLQRGNGAICGQMAWPQRATYEGEIGDSYLLRRVTQPKQAKPKSKPKLKTDAAQRKAPMFPMSSVPILKPGSALYEAFPTALRIALGRPENQERRELAERLRLMSADESSTNHSLRKFLIVAMAYPERAKVIFQPRTDESEKVDTTELEKLWGSLSEEERKPLSSLSPQLAIGGWASTRSLQLDDMPVYQPTLRAVPPDDIVQMAGAPYLCTRKANHLTQLPQSLFPPNTSDPVCEQLQEINSNVTAYAKEHATTWDFNPDKDLNEAVASLRRLVQDEALAGEALGIEQMANDVPGDSVALARLQLEILSREKVRITMKQMLSLFAQRNLGALAK